MSILNQAFSGAEYGPKSVIFLSHHITAIAFTNSSHIVQFLYGPHPVPNSTGSALCSIVGSLYDRSDCLLSLGQLNKKAFSFACTIVRISLPLCSDFHCGPALDVDALKGTTYAGDGVTDYCLMSVPSIYIMGMQEMHHTESYKDTAFRTLFATIS